MTFLHSWILFPAVAVALSLGAGLILRRIAGPALPGTLVFPAGFALLMVLSVLLTWKEPTSGLAAPAVAVVGVAGLVVGARALLASLRARREWLWPAVAGLLPFLVVVLPVLPTGSPGFTGFARIVDLAFQLDYTEWLQQAGQTTAPSGVSSFLDVANRMVGIGYPGGGQALLGSLARVTGLESIWAWQPFLGLLAAVLGLSLYVVLERAIPSRPWRALAAAVAAQPTVLFSYALTSGIKELAAAALIALTAAILAAHRTGSGSLRDNVPLAVALAAAFSSLSLGVIPWLGILALVVIVAELLGAAGEARRRVVVDWAFTLGLTALITVPGIVAAVRLAPVATSGGPAGLGNLAAPVPIWSTAGVWLTSDYRFPLSEVGTQDLTYALAAVVVLLAVLGAGAAARRRDWTLLALGAAGLIGMLYVVRASAEWSDFKAYGITAPIVLACAFAGAASLRAPGPRLAVAGALTLVVAGAVLAGNFLVYRGTTLAPYDRYADLEDINDRYAGQGPALYPVFDEYAEYLLRDVEVSALVDPAGFVTGLAPYAKPGLQFVRDPDEYLQSYLDTRELLIIRRDPTLSRPPGNFRLEERTEHHDVWRREDRGPRVVAHLPLEGGRTPAAICRRLEQRLEQAGAGARVRYATAPDIRQVGADRISENWRRSDPDFLADGPGVVEGDVQLPRTQRWQIWLRGSIGRPVRVRVDGEPVRTVRWVQSYPGLYIHLGERRLAAGTHRVEVRRGGGASLLPGTGNEVASANQTALVGPVTFVPAEPARMETTSADEGLAHCRRGDPLDWIEVVRAAPQ